MIVEFSKDLKAGLDNFQKTEIGETPMKGFLMLTADRSDPLNELSLLGFRYGNCGGRVTFDNMEGFPNAGKVAEGVTALLQFVLDNAEEIRKGIA